ncbi:oxidoreductase, FAD-containing subunit [Candidatus Scalindua japonica]|uniref:Oxidoreductase, FAD-containing subunit n=1 Tax=Candidatus Scalindua japonica TaxID=1284222 RepID=A0A286U2R8_9BACT|nr:FAD-dependent oxidoreductase [Candidatus Scalindua japonica]GAX62433.1 oxidoreductase, FAD-containing subunit [Candidatus Scalindua japonica]
MDYKVVQADESWFRENISCQYACPVNTPASSYIERIQEGEYDSALGLNYMANLFPHILGRVCTHPCESACRRGKIDEPVSICSLKRVAADFAEKEYPKNRLVAKTTGKRIAIIGAGPSGLAAGNDLSIMGHDVTIYEALPMAGGMLSVGIPPYRLPWNKIEGAVNWIKELGIELKLNSPISNSDEFEKLVDNYDAVYIAAGAHKSPELNILGEDLGGVLHGITYMKDINLGRQQKVPSKVAVVGGGFTAIDCARSSLRLGAKEVFIIYRRTLKEMPAGEFEVSMAEEEAIKILYLTTPVKISGNENAKVKAIECVKNKLGEPDASGRRRPEPVPGTEFTLSVDMVIAAIGQSPDTSFITEKSGVKFTKWGTIEVDADSFTTGRTGVFAGGDFMTGPRNAIEVIGDGRKAAKSIDKYLSGDKERTYDYFFKDQDPVRNDPGYESIPRQEQNSVQMDARWDIDKEVELGFSKEDASKEADRCLLCHYNIFIDEKCILCGGCIDVCPHNCIEMISRDKVDTEDLPEGSIPDDWDAVMAIDEEKCIRCGLCVKRCPVDAIKMKRFSYAEAVV